MEYDVGRGLGTDVRLDPGLGNDVRLGGWRGFLGTDVRVVQGFGG